MKPTQILQSEHRVIEQVLECLERMVKKARTDGRLEAEPAKDAVAFFRNFADKCHHGKEEAHLFPALEAKGYSRDCGPTGVMLAEHRLGRIAVGGMAESIPGAAAGDKEALGKFFEHAKSYIELLRAHIQKEDHCLFPMANEALTKAEQAHLLSAFEKVEVEEMGAGTHEKFAKIADDLADRYKVPRAVVAGEGASRCCGH